ncbi:hypothetical protein PHYPSEUDO_007067 [Phytophthora pseudosyringae]|uniref:Uncharacterized protein n=1 Tax=Phytophthora pseudosyringae TaxID=221518 RepID=A0A8T1VGY0_9STRA|nr:hypothetical protein PHYPSEUDO_007067 [Phytophthora pseudosyringae]
MVKRGSKPRRTASAVDQLQAALTRSLKESVVETVSSVCGSFQHAVEGQSAAAASTEDGGGYDQYYNTCRRLVDYIEQHMEASPGFGEQMDRIILACHSGATERVLNSVVTKELWFHRRGDAPPSTAAPGREKRSSRATNSSSSGGGGVRSRSVAKKKVKREFATSSSPRLPTRASTESPAMHTRSTAGSKRATRGGAYDAQPVKRPRRAARNVIQESSDEEEKDGEEEEIEEEEEVKPAKSRKGKDQQHNGETGGGGDELLSFKEAIGELCYPDRRTPSETKFFKEQLRKSIQFVDALLCKPPPGKVCGRGCKKIRAQMCSSSTPCKNKMCRIWHDVEAHTDRCQNPQCEFKNRILLRETMHKLEMKEQQIAVAKAALESKQAELEEAANDDKEALEDDIASLEHDLEECDSELGVLEATKKTFWGNLNEIGIEVRHDVIDNFPEFATHYEDKKTPRKARKSAAPSAALLTPASSRSSRAAARLGSAGPHGGDAEDEDEADDADGESVGENIFRPTARRSTSSGRHSAPSHHESDEETKGGDEETKDEDDDTFHHDSNDLPQPDEPPLPPAGPPPFRQNPELDRDYAASASGYSIHPPTDDLEAPALATSIEPTKHVEAPSESGLTQEQLADMQRASEEISGIMAGMSANPPPAEPLNTTGFTIRGNQPQNP